MSIINDQNAALTVGDSLVRSCIMAGKTHEYYKDRWRATRACLELEEPIPLIKYQEYELDWWEIKS